MFEVVSNKNYLFQMLLYKEQIKIKIYPRKCILMIQNPQCIPLSWSRILFDYFYKIKWAIIKLYMKLGIHTMNIPWVYLRETCWELFMYKLLHLRVFDFSYIWTVYSQKRKQKPCTYNSWVCFGAFLHILMCGM